MNELKWCTQAELNQYEKTSDWNVHIYNEFLIEKNLHPLFKKIAREAEFYQSLEFYLNKISDLLELDTDNLTQILKLNRKYTAVFTNFLGSNILEIRGKNNYFINFKQDQKTKMFYFYSTNGNPVDATSCFSNLISPQN